VDAGLGATPDLSLEALHRSFENPPDSSRIMVRWWWFGPAVTKPELTRELEQMKAAGIGGVELATLYALALNDPDTGAHNATYLSDEHLDLLRFAVDEARRLGLRVDLTLGSGWPLGGPEIPVTEAAGMLRVESRPVSPRTTRVQAPFIDQGEALLAAFLLPASASQSQTAGAAPLPAPSDGWYSVPAAVQAHSLICFISSRTGMVVKRPAVGAEGFVLDHYDHAAINEHLRAVDDRLLTAFGDQPPYAVFSDSLEDYASDWTPSLLDEFERRRGYDLRPHLLALVMGDGPESAAVRHDWGRTLTELADDNFLAPMHAWAAQHHTLLRSQTYGFPPVSLYSNRFSDLPEGEGKATFMMWREFSDTRWAASAGHLFHHPVISSETWTWLHSPAFRATPLDMKAEADLHFLQGINQLVGHGWPFSPPSAGDPGWRMYAAAALNAHNPWFIAMPDLTRYLQRVSFALRQGEPANDVALLLPTDDVWASFVAKVQKRASPTSALGFDESGSNITVDEQMDKFLGKRVVAQVLDAGFNLDFIDADTIDSVGIPYRVLILPSVDRLPVKTYEKILAFAQHGGIVIATGRTPATAPGLMHAEEDTARLKALSQVLFHGNIATAHFVADETMLGATIARSVPPDMKLSPATPAVGFIHRKLAHGDLYFVANTSNQAQKVRARFRSSSPHAEEWDAFTGKISAVLDPQNIDLDLEAYGSRLIFFSDEPTPAKLQPSQRETRIFNLSSDWKVTFGEGGLSKQMDHLESWTADASTQYFSGLATYEKSFDLPGEPSAGVTFFLDLGTASATPLPDPPGQHNMWAYLDAPVRDAAQVYVNGTLAGVVWHPPYRVDITSQLHAGHNQLRIVVGNTAINELAGEPLPDYRLLWDRYGKLFEPQDMKDLHPLPSGLLGPVRLIEAEAVK
jgi:hypothetical protein